MLNGKSVLVTGAKGFLGGHLISRLKEVGARVYATGRGVEVTSPRERSDLIFLGNHMITERYLKDLNTNFDYMYHFASLSSVSLSFNNPIESNAEDLNALYEILEYIRKNSIGTKLIFPSSAAVYGQSTNARLRESEPLRPISPYGLNKYLSEELCNYYIRCHSLEIKILRFFSLYGPRLRRQLVWDALEKIRLGNTVFSGTGEESRDWVYIKDAIELLIRITQVRFDENPIMNVGTGITYTTRYVIELLAQHLQAKVNITFDGATRPGDPTRLVADTTQVTNLGWIPEYSLENGLKECVRWYEAEVQVER